MFQCISLFKLELECREMENRIITRSLRRQLNQVLLHEQKETWFWCFDSCRKIEIQYVRKGGRGTKVQIYFISLLLKGSWKSKVWTKSLEFEPLIHYMVQQKVAN